MAAYVSIEKKKDALVVKLLQYRNANNETRAMSLSTDGSSSKKTIISFNANKDSMENKMTKKGVSSITGGATDGFGAVQNESLQSLSWPVECVEGLNGEDRVDSPTG